LHCSQLEAAEEAPSKSGREAQYDLQAKQISFPAAVDSDLQTKQITHAASRN
jgi:hypothetical protein